MRLFPRPPLNLVDLPLSLCVHTPRTRSRVTARVDGQGPESRGADRKSLDCGAENTADRRVLLLLLLSHLTVQSRTPASDGVGHQRRQGVDRVQGEERLC